MKSRLLKSMLTAACVLGPLGMTATAPADAQSVVQPVQDVILSIGNGQLVNVPGSMSDVFVANDAVADVQVKSTSQLYVFGKAAAPPPSMPATLRARWSGPPRSGSDRTSTASTRC